MSGMTEYNQHRWSMLMPESNPCVIVVSYINSYYKPCFISYVRNTASPVAEIFNFEQRPASKVCGSTRDFRDFAFSTHQPTNFYLVSSQFQMLHRLP